MFRTRYNIRVLLEGEADTTKDGSRCSNTKHFLERVEGCGGAAAAAARRLRLSKRLGSEMRRDLTHCNAQLDFLIICYAHSALSASMLMV